MPTPRSSGAPTAGHQGLACGTRCIFTARALVACRWQPRSLNVRLHKVHSSRDQVAAATWKLDSATLRGKLASGKLTEMTKGSTEFQSYPAIGNFFYSAGHFQHHAANVMGLGSLGAPALTTEITSQVPLGRPQQDPVRRARAARRESGRQPRRCFVGLRPSDPASMGHRRDGDRHHAHQYYLQPVVQPLDHAAPHRNRGLSIRCLGHDRTVSTGLLHPNLVGKNP
jgi:hypothetical protein